MHRDSKGTNQRIYFDIDPSGRYLGTGGQVGGIVALTREELQLLTYALTHSLTHSLTRSLARSLTHSLTHSFTHSLAHSLTHSHTHTLMHSLAHQHTRSCPLSQTLLLTSLASLQSFI